MIAKAKKKRINDEIRVHKVSNTPTKLLDSAFVDNQHYTLMKAGGINLFDVLKAHNDSKSQCGLTAPLIKSTMSAIADQVKYLHGKNAIHGDIKLKNILINPATGEVSLIDFGIAEISPKGNEFTTEQGTPGYIAPEVMFDTSYTNKADVFSLGVVFAQLLIPETYGKNNIPIYMEAYEHEDKFKTKLEQAQKIWEACKKILAAVAEKYGDKSNEYGLLSKMLEMDKNERFTMAEVLKHAYFGGKKTYFELASQHHKAIKTLAKSELRYKHLKLLEDEEKVDINRKIALLDDVIRAKEVMKIKRCEVKLLQEQLSNIASS